MADFTDAELDASEAAFEKAYTDNDARAMNAIFQSPVHNHAVLRRAKKTIGELALLRREGGPDDRIDRLTLFALIVEISDAAQAKMHVAAMHALQARIEELEKQPFAYDGPHESGKTYRKGTFVTHGGSLWHANYTTAARPGDGPAWTLAVKHGQDLR